MNSTHCRTQLTIVAHNCHIEISNSSVNDSYKIGTNTFAVVYGFIPCHSFFFIGKIETSLLRINPIVRTPANFIYVLFAGGLALKGFLFLFIKPEYGLRLYAYLCENYFTTIVKISRNNFCTNH